MSDSLATFDNMILTGLILATKRPTAAAFSSTAFVMDTSFQRPNYDNQKAECKAQHEKGRLQSPAPRKQSKLGMLYVHMVCGSHSFQGQRMNGDIFPSKVHPTVNCKAHFKNSQFEINFLNHFPSCI